MSQPSKGINHQVTPSILNAAQVDEIIEQIDVAKVLKQMFADLSKEQAVQPPQSLTLFPQDAGDFITYTGVIAGAEVFGAKLSPYIVTGGKPVITAWTYLMSCRTGQPLLCCDSSKLTTERTAGTTALAVDYLAKAQSKTLTIIGSGAIAQAHLRHVAGLRQWQQIKVFSPNLANKTEVQNEWLALDGRVQIATSKAQAIDGADVIMLCTSSGTPVIEAGDAAPGVLITSISTNVANAHEIPPQLLSQCEVYCDYKETTPDSAGEMKIAAQEHGWDKAGIRGDLADLAGEKAVLPSDEKPIFFRSLGLGLEDIAIAYGVWQLLQQVENTSV